MKHVIFPFSFEVILYYACKFLGTISALYNELKYHSYVNLFSAFSFIFSFIFLWTSAICPIWAFELSFLCHGGI